MIYFVVSGMSDAQLDSWLLLLLQLLLTDVCFASFVSSLIVGCIELAWVRGRLLLLHDALAHVDECVDLISEIGEAGEGGVREACDAERARRGRELARRARRWSQAVGTSLHQAVVSPLDTSERRRDTRDRRREVEMKDVA